MASYLFYGWWDWRFLILIAFTSTWSYVFGVFELGAKERSAASKWRLAISCVINLGILGYFKYAGFFVREMAAVLEHLGFHTNIPSLQVILPVGISFYTFQALSYTIDVYRRQIKPTRDPIAFFAFISFFPQLVAGPIERASNLLPQFLKKREFSYPLAAEGCRQILWGFFKKLLVADNCSIVANTILGNKGSGGAMIWLGLTAFAFQIYGDFSGYSDIAIGCGKLFGIRIMRNFAYPYFARDIAEFWRKWHISLTTWFRDYIYIPLGGSRCGMAKKIRNTFIVFLVSGLWHGASKTFIAWGAYHALLFIPLMLLGRNRRNLGGTAEGRIVPSVADCLRMMVTFALVVVGWAFFRAPSISIALRWIVKMATFTGGLPLGALWAKASNIVVPITMMLFLEWVGRRSEIPVPLFIPRRPIRILNSCGKILRWGFYYAIFAYVVYGHPQPQTFIYFQF